MACLIIIAFFHYSDRSIDHVWIQAIFFLLFVGGDQKSVTGTKVA